MNILKSDDYKNLPKEDQIKVEKVALTKLYSLMNQNFNNLYLDTGIRNAGISLNNQINTAQEFINTLI